jgi:hypothetical protein
VSKRARELRARYLKAMASNEYRMGETMITLWRQWAYEVTR